MKAVLISIRPEWCDKIANGAKTIEVRKTRPKLEPPFKCYIYCTKPNTHDPHKILEIHGAAGRIHRANGKVIGEFVCDWADTFMLEAGPIAELSLGSLVTPQELYKYAASYMGLYGWHISDLVIYDAPKDLGEFWRLCPECNELGPNCWDCENRCGDDEVDCNTSGRLYLTRPPQSWCYVEEVDNG